MSDYTKTTDFTAKDSLPTGDPNKIAKGSEVDTEFDNIQTAVNSKANKVTSPVPENILIMSSTGDLLDGDKGLPTGDVVGTTDTQTLTNKTLTSPTISSPTINSTSVTGTPWHSGNDGSGSGLDADTLDGNQSGNSSGQVPVSNGTVCSNLNADKLDGEDAADIVTTSRVATATAGVSVGDVGTYAFLASKETTASPGDVIAGTNLYWAGMYDDGVNMNIVDTYPDTNPSGNWMAMGKLTPGTDAGTEGATLFLRVS